jgi:hypothetical protein
MSSNQDHPSTSTRKRSAVEQQIYDPPAAFYSPMSIERYQASTPTRAVPAFQQQSYIPPDTAYLPSISSGQNQPSALSRARPASEQQNYGSPAAYASAISPDQNQASTPTVARPVIEQRDYGPRNQGLEHKPRDRAGFFATVMNPDTNAATPAHENTVWPSEQRTQAQLDAMGQNTAALTSRDQADTAPWNPPVVMADPNDAAAISVEHENRTWGSQLEQRIREEMRPTSATMAMEAERDRAAAKSAERKKAHRASEVEQRAQEERYAIERNRLALAARTQARDTSWKPSTVTTDANSAVAVSAGRENMDRVSEIEQRIRAETNAAVAEQSRDARLVAARENMERIPEAEQRSQAQWKAINRAASSNPPDPVADVNRAGAPLAARDGGHDAAHDSLFSSPFIPSARPPQPQTLNTSPGTPMTVTTAPGQHSTIDQHRPHAPRTTEELLQITRRDPRYLTLTAEEKRDRTKAMNQARYVKKRKEAGNAARSG